MGLYSSLETCVINRRVKPGKAVLLNEHEDQVFEFDASFSDEQIMVAVSLARAAHYEGVVEGRKQKAAEIRAVIGAN